MAAPCADPAAPPPWPCSLVSRELKLLEQELDLSLKGRDGFTLAAKLWSCLTEEQQAAFATQYGDLAEVMHVSGAAPGPWTAAS